MPETKKYMVHGTYTINFDIEVKADSPSEACKIVENAESIEHLVRKSFFVIDNLKTEVPVIFS